MAGAVGRVEDLVIENGEVECEAETDGVSRREVRLGDVGGGLREKNVLVKLSFSKEEICGVMGLENGECRF